MSKEVPDNWVIIHIADDLFKILAGWSEGFTGQDSWRINSGITKIEELEHYYLIYGYSGSVYKCYKNSEQLRMSTIPVWNMIQNKLPEVKIVKIDEIKHKFII